MSQDIFDTLDKAGFGSNVHEIAAEGECRVLRIDDESGEGFMKWTPEEVEKQNADLNEYLIRMLYGK